MPDNHCIYVSCADHKLSSNEKVQFTKNNTVLVHTCSSMTVFNYLH